MMARRSRVLILCPKDSKISSGYVCGRKKKEEGIFSSLTDNNEQRKSSGLLIPGTVLMTEMVLLWRAGFRSDVGGSFKALKE